MKKQTFKTPSPQQHPKKIQVPPNSKVKAALILLSLGEDLAASLLNQLPRHEVLGIAQAMKRLTPGSPELEPEVINSVLEEFEGILTAMDKTNLLHPQDFLKSMEKKLSSSLHSQVSFDADWTTPKIRETLEEMPLGLLSSFLTKEHPQTVAIILAHLEAAKGGNVVKSLPENMRLEALIRLAQLKEVSHEALEQLAESLIETLHHARLTPHGSNSWEKGRGAEKVAEMLSRLEPISRQQMLDGLLARDPELHREVLQKMFQFSDLSRLSAKDLAKVIASTAPKTLLLALKGCSASIRQSWLSAMSTRSAQRLSEDLEQLPPTKITEINAAQESILAAVRLMIDSQEIEWRDPSDIYI